LQFARIAGPFFQKLRNYIDMKQFATLLFMMLSLALSSFAQKAEEAAPLLDTEIERKVDFIDIDGELFDKVVVTFKSNSPDGVFTEKYKVKVSITDSNGDKIWKKTLKNDFLYVFSDGTVQVGRKNFTKIIIFKTSSGKIYGKIRLKEGIY